LTQDHFCGWSGWGRTTVYRLILENRIPYQYIGGRPVIDPFEFIRYIRKYHLVPPAHGPHQEKWAYGNDYLAEGYFPFVRARQYADTIGISTFALYRMLKARRIPHYKVRGTYYVDPDEIEAWLEACRISTLAEEIDLLWGF